MSTVVSVAPHISPVIQANRWRKLPSYAGYVNIGVSDQHKVMTHYEVAFKLQHDCPYNEFSKAHADTVISHWCNWKKDILEIAHKDIQNEQVQQSIREMIRALNTRVIRKSNTASNLQVVLQQCACDNIPPPTVPMIEQHNCLELQPAVYAEGWEWYRVIAFSEKDIKNLFKDLDQFGVQVVSRRTVLQESVRDTFVLSTATLFGDLTDKQLRALITALDNGYYNLPRKATAAEIAARAGVPRTSFVDHLRKAENKVLRSVGPYLRLKPEEARKDRRPYAVT